MCYGHYQALCQTLRLPVMLKILQECPSQAFTKASRLPVIHTLWKVWHGIPDGTVVRNDNEDVLEAVELLQIPERCLGKRQVITKRDVVEGFPCSFAPGLLELGERASRAETGLQNPWGARVRTDLVRHWHVLRRAEDAGVVACISAEEHEGVLAASSATRVCGPGESTQMTHGMPRCIEDIEGAIAEVVIGGEMTDAKALWTIKLNFTEVATTICGRNWGIWSAGISHGSSKPCICKLTRSRSPVLASLGSLGHQGASLP